MKKCSTGLLSVMVFACGIQAAETEVTTTTNVTQTVTETKIITETVVQEKKEWSPFKICVLDFTTINEKGQLRFLNQENKAIDISAQCTLNDKDRSSINGVMQGFVRMIDAMSNSKTQDANRSVQEDDNAFTREKALTLYNSTVHGVARPSILGAEYLSSYLMAHNDVFSCVEAMTVGPAMNKLQNAADFPKDFMLRLAKETGATHLLYGTVSDITSKQKSFKGYGIETKSTVYELDVIVKLVDLIAQRTVYGRTYTGTYREQQLPNMGMKDNNIFQNLMKSALQQVAEDLYDQCKPGRKNKICVTPMPYWVTLNVKGKGFGGKKAVEIYVDDKLAGNGKSPLLLSEGEHKVVVKADGFSDKQLNIEVKEDKSIDVAMEK